MAISLCPQPARCWLVSQRGQGHGGPDRGRTWYHLSERRDGDALGQDGHVLGLASAFPPAGTQAAPWSEASMWFDPPAQGPATSRQIRGPTSGARRPCVIWPLPPPLISCPTPLAHSTGHHGLPDGPQTHDLSSPRGLCTYSSLGPNGFHRIVLVQSITLP